MHLRLNALVFAVLTGGSLTRAVVIAVIYFAVATGWSWFRFRQQEARGGRRGS